MLIIRAVAAVLTFVAAASAALAQSTGYFTAGMRFD